MIHRYPLLYSLIACFLPTSDAIAGERVAVVVGIKDYLDLAALKNAKSDASKVAEKLRANGFKVYQNTGEKLSDILETIKNFRNHAAKGNISNFVFYFSGHGTEYNGSNWLIGADFNADSTKKNSFPLYSINLESLFDVISESNITSSVFLIDACRTPGITLADGTITKPGLYFAPRSFPNNYMLIFAAGKNSIAYDRFEGWNYDNSVFTKYFLDKVSFSGDFSSEIKLVQKSVYNATKNLKPSQFVSIYDQSPFGFQLNSANPNKTEYKSNVTLSIFYRDNRIDDAIKLSSNLKLKKISSAIVNDDLSSIKMKKPSGTYRIVFVNNISTTDRKTMMETADEIKKLGGVVDFDSLYPNQIRYKPFQIQLF